MHALDHIRDAERMTADGMARLNGHSPKWRAVYAMRRFAEDSLNDRARAKARKEHRQ